METLQATHGNQEKFGEKFVEIFFLRESRKNLKDVVHKF